MHTELASQIENIVEKLTEVKGADENKRTILGEGSWSSHSKWDDKPSRRLCFYREG